MTLSNIWQSRQAGAVAALHKIFAGWLTRFAENLHTTVCAVVVLFAEQAGGCSAVMTDSDWRSAVCWYIHTVWCCSEEGGGGYSQHWPGCTKFLSVQLCPYSDKILFCLYTYHSSCLEIEGVGGPGPSMAPPSGNILQLFANFVFIRKWMSTQKAFFSKGVKPVCSVLFCSLWLQPFDLQTLY